MASFGFDESDLAANQSGELTEKQLRVLYPNALQFTMARLSPIRRVVAWTTELMLALFALLSLISLALLAIMCVWDANEVTTGLGLALIFAAVEITLLWLIRRKTRQIRTDRRKINTIAGIIKLQPGSSHRPPLLRLNRRRFPLTDDQFAALKSGLWCRLYFVGDVILSLELGND